MSEPAPQIAGSVVLPRLLRDLLQGGRAVHLELTGHSMTPLIRSGDVATIVPCPPGRPRLGDVVAYAAGADRLVVHRIVRRSGDRLLPRGDVSPAADRPIGRDDVLGLVTRVERRGREIRVGQGPERLAIAWLSRIGVLRAAALLRALSRGVGARSAGASPRERPPSATA